MRESEPGRAWSVTIILLVVNVVVFFAEHSRGETTRQWFREYGALSLGGLERGFVWQFFTYQFMHGGLTHLALNSFVLYSFGRIVEDMLGRRSFLKLYLLSGVAGGLLQILVGLLLPTFIDPKVATVGASASICGLVAVLAMLAPDATIYLFMVLPMRARTFLPLTIVLSLVLFFAWPKSQIAHAAHLGGTFLGMAYLRWFQTLGVRLPGFARLRLPRRSRPVVKVRFPKAIAEPGPRPGRSEESGPTDFISKEVDPILEKISAHGIHSLTERERRILEAARAKIEKH